MLRIIVISLVVANLLLLGFQSSTPTVKPEARPAPAVVKDSGIPTIHLFSEMMQDQGLMSGNRHCFTIGPFHAVADWDDVHMRLQKVATRISERQTEALVDRGYWVYMPPYPSLLEANEALLSLQALGLEDVAIIYDGEWKNSISLGYFMRQENAQRRKKALEDRGFKPMMRIQRQSEPRFWLDYEQEPGSGLVELDMQNRPNDFMQRPVPCPEAEFLEDDAVASQDAVESPTQAQARETNLESDAGLDAGGTGDNALSNDDAETTGAVAEEKTAPETVDEPDEAPVDDDESAPDQSQATSADRTAEIPAAGEAEGTSGDGAEIEAHPVQATVADQIDAAPTAEEAVKTTGEAVENVSNEGLDEARGSGEQPPPAAGTVDAGSAEVEDPPKQAVGTGPVDMVSIASGPVEAGVEGQDAGKPAGGAPDVKIGDGVEEPADDGKEDTTATPSGETGEQDAPEETKKDNGNGTVDGR